MSEQQADRPQPALQRPEEEPKHPGVYDYWWTPYGRPPQVYYQPPQVYYQPPPYYSQQYYPQQYPYPYQVPSYNPWSYRPVMPAGLSVTSMVLGIISIMFGCIWGLGILLGGLAVIFGIVAKRKCKRGEAGGSGMAVTGIVTGLISIATSALALVALINNVSKTHYY